MKVDPLDILLNENFKVDKRFYFVSGNEITLMEKISGKICEKYRNKDKVDITNIDNLANFTDNGSLFEDRKILLGKNCKETTY